MVQWNPTQNKTSSFCCGTHFPAGNRSYVIWSTYTICFYHGFSGFAARNILDYGIGLQVYRGLFYIDWYIDSEKMRKNKTSQLPFIPSICFSLLLGGNFLWRHRSTNEAWCDRNLHLTWKTEQHGSSGELRSPFYIASRVKVMFNEWIQCCYCIVALVFFCMFLLYFL